VALFSRTFLVRLASRALAVRSDSYFSRATLTCFYGSTTFSRFPLHPIIRVFTSA
jgi:hypothetical protein